jgi:hypothetical protein
VRGEARAWRSSDSEDRPQVEKASDRAPVTPLVQLSCHILQRAPTNLRPTRCCRPMSSAEAAAAAARSRPLRPADDAQKHKHHDWSPRLLLGILAEKTYDLEGAEEFGNRLTYRHAVSTVSGCLSVACSLSTGPTQLPFRYYEHFNVQTLPTDARGRSGPVQPAPPRVRRSCVAVSAHCSDS